MRTLLGGLILTCLMLLTACSQTDTWDTWHIECEGEEPYRFEGAVNAGNDSGTVYLYSRKGGRIMQKHQPCTYTYLGEGGVVSR